jgi:hypothetical protein
MVLLPLVRTGDVENLLLRSLGVILHGEDKAVSHLELHGAREHQLRTRQKLTTGRGQHFNLHRLTLMRRRESALLVY